MRDVLVAQGGRNTTLFTLSLRASSPQICPHLGRFPKEQSSVVATECD